MTGFEAFNDVQPQKNAKCYKLKKVKTSSHIWPVIFMFILISMLCANHYVLLRSYENLKNDLANAYKALNEEKETNKKLAIESAELQKKYRELSGLFNKLNEDYSEISRGSDDLLLQVEELKKKNSELEKQIKDLANDNIALQNTLKKAASAGIKPQNYSLFEGLEQRDTINRGKFIGKFLGTAYTPSAEECGNDKGITKSGEPIIPGISVAVDNRYWPFGTVFYIKGLGYTVAMDTGSAIKGKYRFDFSVLDKGFAMELGSRKWDVYLVKMGKGYVGDIKL